ncbi:MAG: NPCBM/NEW2 domain-containing protein [bacterium]|jgi:alpha-galactosidase|nr:NPCBM/NEW2 domain-containing protein [bacterium]
MPNPCRFLPFLLILAILPSTPLFAEETIALHALDLEHMSSGWGRPVVGKSIENKPLTLNGEVYTDGVGTHALSILHVELDGRVQEFTALVGVDDETEGKGSIEVKITGDQAVLFESGPIRGGDPAIPIAIELEGVKRLVLIATGSQDGIGYDHVDWVQAQFTYTGEPPKAIPAPSLPPEEKIILTPKPGPEPKINGPSLYGCRPDRPFLYRIPCTGTRPISFAVENLPKSLQLDPHTGILTGHTPEAKGEYLLTLHAQSAHGSYSRTLKLVVGDTLALTPPMGWNHWYSFYDRISHILFREAADAMIESGMADFGYQYVNIDDCWMRKRETEDPMLQGEPRTADGTILTNSHFPDMKDLTDHIHGKGLKAGIYTSPGPWTCAGYTGSYQHEAQDAKTFAAWGFDFLKYDWCSYTSVAGGNSLDHLIQPYRLMGEILEQLDRDIIYNLCQYGMGDVWTWAGSIGGHCWRTTGDLGLQAGDLLPGFYHIGLSNAQHAAYAKPGQWNDPDYILIGSVGDAHKQDAPPIPTALTPNEQYSYMSMWSLMAAPLIYSGDIRHLDEFTLNILCNAEVIEVNQDPLGKQAAIVRHGDDTLILAKPLEDGSLSVGLFNLAEAERTLSVTWPELGLGAVKRVRDVWRQMDEPGHVQKLEVRIPRHGVKMVRIWPAEE